MVNHAVSIVREITNVRLEDAVSLQTLEHIWVSCPRKLRASSDFDCSYAVNAPTTAYIDSIYDKSLSWITAGIILAINELSQGHRMILGSTSSDPTIPRKGGAGLVIMRT